MASALYRSIISDQSLDGREREFVAAVCGPTPWMLELSPDECSGQRIDRIAGWCADSFGPPAMPLMKQAGEWHVGTLGELAWIGFRLEKQMRAFIARRLTLATIAEENGEEVRARPAAAG